MTLAEIILILCIVAVVLGFLWLVHLERRGFKPHKRSREENEENDIIPLTEP